jgi:hypothetical protein
MKEQRWALGAAALLLLLMVTAQSTQAQQEPDAVTCEREAAQTYAVAMQDAFDWFSECRGSVLEGTSCEYFEPFGCDWCTKDFNEESDEAFKNYILDSELCELLG